MNNGMKVGILGLAVLAMGSAASAAPLGLVKTEPDIYSNRIGIFYTANTDTFVAVGNSITIEPTIGATVPLTTAYFNLNATINDSGNASSGTVTFYGTQASLGYNSGVLLTGTLVPGAFGYLSSGGNTFEFIFNVTGGDAAAIYGSKVAMILNAAFESSPGTDFTGSFSSNFSNVTSSGSYSLVGQADAFAVPEPASLAVLGLTGIIGLWRRR